MKQTTMERERDFFNARAEHWLDMWYRSPKARSRRKYTREFQRLFELVSIRRNDVILDVGCGSGILAPRILRRLGPRGRLHELDYAERMIEVNRRLHPDPRIRFHVADAHTPPLPAKACDGIFCFCCFPHFNDKPRALAAMAKTLKYNGWLVLAHFDNPRELDRHHARAHAAVKRHRMPDAAATCALLAKAGLTVTRHDNDRGFYAFVARKQH